MRKNENLIKLIDDYGSIDKEIKALTKTKEEIKKSLSDLKPGSYEGNQYILTIAETVNYSFSTEKIYEKLGKSKFLECVKVLTEKIKEFISPHDLQKFVEKTETTKRFIIKRKE